MKIHKGIAEVQVSPKNWNKKTISLQPWQCQVMHELTNKNPNAQITVIDYDNPARQYTANLSKIKFNQLMYQDPNTGKSHSMKGLTKETLTKKFNQIPVIYSVYSLKNA